MTTMTATAKQAPIARDPISAFWDNYGFIIDAHNKKALGADDVTQVVVSYDKDDNLTSISPTLKIMPSNIIDVQGTSVSVEYNDVEFVAYHNGVPCQFQSNCMVVCYDTEQESTTDNQGNKIVTGSVSPFSIMPKGNYNQLHTCVI